MTGKMTTDGGGFEALERALERYGSDRTRWPAPVRRDLAGLLSGNAAAERRLAEAEALDRLLDLMPEPEIDTRSLASRILAAADAGQIPAQAPPAARIAWARSNRPEIRAEAPWAAAALLAASLVVGAFVGQTSTFNNAFETASTETSDETATDPGQIAFDNDALGLFEEDLL